MGDVIRLVSGEFQASQAERFFSQSLSPEIRVVDRDKSWLANLAQQCGNPFIFDHRPRK
jgi:hypothetical protein